MIDLDGLNGERTPNHGPGQVDSHGVGVEERRARAAGGERHVVQPRRQRRQVVGQVARLEAQPHRVEVRHDLRQNGAPHERRAREEDGEREKRQQAEQADEHDAPGLEPPRGAASSA